MFCENCGNKIDETHKFCTKCGHSASVINEEEKKPVTDKKWWLRFVKVIYISLYIILPFLLIFVWDDSRYYGSAEEAFWLTLLTFVVYIVSVRLIKITFLYIAFAQKPQWKKEFKKFF